MSNFILDVIFHTFPRGLRFNRQSRLLYSKLIMLNRRYKHKRHIPRKEFDDIIAQYSQPPFRWMSNPILSNILFLNIIVFFRMVILRTKEQWLINRNCEEDLEKLKKWLKFYESGINEKSSMLNSNDDKSKKGKSFLCNDDKEEKINKTSSCGYLSKKETILPFGLSRKNFIDREKFTSEYINNFHISTTFHFVFILGIFIILLLLSLLLTNFFAEKLLYLYVCYYKKNYSKEQVKRFFDDIEESHLISDIPEGYRNLLPPPSVIMNSSDVPTFINDACSNKTSDFVDENNKNKETYVINIIEMQSPNRKVNVVFVPMPVLGPESFFKEIGSVLSCGDVMILEGVSLTDTHKQPPSTYFPLKKSLFEFLDLSHRFYYILGSNKEPPLLLPGSSPTSYLKILKTIFLPYMFQSLLYPFSFSTKGEARLGWSWLMETIEMIQKLEKSNEKTSKNIFFDEFLRRNDLNFTKIIIVPWSVNQIANLEASLLKKGFDIVNVLPIRWLERGHMGHHFVKYFGIL